MGPEVSSSQPYCPPGRLFRDHATQNSFGYSRVAVFPDADGPQTDPLSQDVQTENVVQAIQIPPWGPEEGRAMRVWALPLCNMS